MTRRATSKLGAYAALSGFGLVAALVLGRPEIVALTAPFLLTVGVGLALTGSPRFTAEMEADERAVEGDEIDVRITLVASAPVDRLDVFVRLPPGIELADGKQARSLRLARGERRVLELTLRADRWGAHRLGPVYLRARDSFVHSCPNARLSE